MEVEEIETQPVAEELVETESEEEIRNDAASSLLLPKPSLLRLMKEAAPDAKFTPELQLAINRCCAVFLLFISDGAQEATKNAGKKTIGVVEVNSALIDSGFSEIAEEVRRVLKLENLAVKKRKRQNT